MACSTSCTGPSKYYVGDIGTQIVVDVCGSLATATLVRFDVEKPDGTSASWVGSVYGTTSITYTVVAGDFNQAGEYRLQSYVEMPGWTGHGNTITFKISAIGD